MTGMFGRPGPQRDRLRRFATLPTEVHLRRMKVEPALDRLNRYLDEAAMAGFPRVRVVHGRSGGTMKGAVHAFLGSHPLVTRYYAAAPAEGGAGVTIAELE